MPKLLRTPIFGRGLLRIAKSHNPRTMLLGCGLATFSPVNSDAINCENFVVNTHLLAIINYRLLALREILNVRGLEDA